MIKYLLLLLFPLTLFGQSQKISDMTSATSLTGSEYVPIVQTTNKKATVGLLRGWTSLGTAGQLLKVNAGATALEFFTPTYLSGVVSIANGGTGLSTLGTANQLLRVNAGATGLEYFTPSFLSDTTAFIKTQGTSILTTPVIIEHEGMQIISSTASDNDILIQAGDQSQTVSGTGQLTLNGYIGRGSYILESADVTGSYNSFINGTNGKIEISTDSLFFDDPITTPVTIGHVLTATSTTGKVEWAAPSGGSGLTVGTSTITSGTDTRVLFNNAGVLGEYTISGSGNVAMTTSPTFTTPILGTPTSGILTNATGYLFNNLAAATSSNTINNAANAQEWQWNTLAAGTGLLLSSSSTAAASNTNTLFRVNQTGANATSTQTTYSGYFSNTKTGTSSTNVAAYFDASGGTTNYSIQTGSSPILVNNARMFSAATSNLFWGVSAGSLTLTGVENIGIGTSAGASLSTGNRNTYVGYNAGATQSGGFNNSFFGNAAGRLTTGSANTFVGKSAGETNGTGASNTAVGSSALTSNSSGGSNTAVGVSALSATTAGSNTAIGANAGLYITTGTRVTALGMNTFGQSGNTAPTDGVAIGHNALFGATGLRNLGIGTETLSQAGAVNDHVVIGVNAGDFFAAAGGNQGVIIGSAAAAGNAGTNSSGSNVTLVGYQTGYFNQGSSNIMLGALVNDISSATVTGSNKITIGTDINDQAPTTSNTLTIQNAIYGTGNSATGTTVSSGNIGLYTVAPSARLHLPAGTATASTAPLKIENGTLLTTPENNAIENDGTHLYYTTGSTRYQLDQQIITTKVSLSSAEILNLNSSPKTLVSAPGSGKMIELISISYKYNYLTAAYATNTSLSLLLGSTSLGLYTGIIDQTADSISMGSGSWGLVAVASAFTNQALSLSVSAGNPTAGSGTLDVYLSYRIITL